MAKKYLLNFLLTLTSVNSLQDNKKKKPIKKEEYTNEKDADSLLATLSNPRNTDPNIPPMDYVWKMYERADPDCKTYGIYYFLKTSLYLLATMATLKMTATSNQTKSAHMNSLDVLNIIMYMISSGGIMLGPLITGLLESWNPKNNISSINHKLTNIIQEELIQASLMKKSIFYTTFGSRELKESIATVPKLVIDLISIQGDSWADEIAFMGCLTLKTLISLLKTIEVIISKINDKPANDTLHSVNAHYFLAYIMITGISMLVYYKLQQSIITPARTHVKSLTLNAGAALDDTVSNATLARFSARERNEIATQVERYRHIAMKHREYETKDSWKYIVPLPTIAFTVSRMAWTYFRKSDPNTQFNLLPWNNSKWREFDWKTDGGLKEQFDSVFEELLISGYLATNLIGILKRREDKKMKMLDLEYYLKTAYSCLQKPDVNVKLPNQTAKQGNVDVCIYKPYEYQYDSEEQRLQEFRSDFALRKSNLKPDEMKKVCTGVKKLDQMMNSQNNGSSKWKKVYNVNK